MQLTQWLCSCDNQIHATPSCPDCEGPFHEVIRTGEPLPVEHNPALAMLSKGYVPETPEEIQAVARMQARALVESRTGQDLYSLVGELSDTVQWLLKIVRGIALNEPEAIALISQFTNQTSFEAKGLDLNLMLDRIKEKTDAVSSVFE